MYSPHSPHPHDEEQRLLEQQQQLHYQQQYAMQPIHHHPQHQQHSPVPHSPHHQHHAQHSPYAYPTQHNDYQYQQQQQQQQQQQSSSSHSHVQSHSHAYQPHLHQPSPISIALSPPTSSRHLQLPNHSSSSSQQLSYLSPPISPHATAASPLASPHNINNNNSLRVQVPARRASPAMQYQLATSPAHINSALHTPSSAGSPMYSPMQSRLPSPSPPSASPSPYANSSPYVTTPRHEYPAPPPQQQLHSRHSQSSAVHVVPVHSSTAAPASQMHHRGGSSQQQQPQLSDLVNSSDEENDRSSTKRISSSYAASSSSSSSSRTFLSTAAANFRYALRYYSPFRTTRKTSSKNTIEQNRKKIFAAGVGIVLTVLYLASVMLSCSSFFSPSSCHPFSFRLPYSLTRRPPPPPTVPFTIISLLRDMSSETMKQDKSQFVIQWNALISWTMVVPPNQILIYMDTQESCTRIKSQPELIGIKCLPVPCWNKEHKRPLLDCIFNVAHENTDTEIIAYVNGDILVHSDVQLLVNQISSWFKDFLIVSRRTDTLVPQSLLDEYGQGKTSQEQVNELFSRSISHGTMHSEFGIDLFCYPKSLFNGLNFPAYLAGVYRWDNWLLSEMILKPHVAVIDVTRQGLIVHQEMGKVSHQGRTGAAYNDAIAKGRSGLKYKIGNIKNTDYVVVYGEDGKILSADGGGGEAGHGHSHSHTSHKSTGKELIGDIARLTTTSSSPSPTLHFHLLPNHNASIEVLISKQVNRDGWLAILPVTSYDLDSGHFDNWICWAGRVNFTSFIFLAADRLAGSVLHGRNYPVLQFDEAPERSVKDESVREDYPVLQEGDRPYRPKTASWTDQAILAASTSPTRLPSVSTYDFLMFRLEFQSIILRSGYNFLFTHLNTVWFEDPLKYMRDGGRREVSGFETWVKHEEVMKNQTSAMPSLDTSATAGQPSPSTPNDIDDFDIASTGHNSTHIDGHLYVVRATPAGKLFWKAFYTCEEQNGAILYAQITGDQSATIPGVDRTKPEGKQLGATVVDCFNTVLTKMSSKVRRFILPYQLFPNHTTYFADQLHQLHSLMPIMFRDETRMSLRNSIPDTIHRRETTGESVEWRTYAQRVDMFKQRQMEVWKEAGLLAVNMESGGADVNGKQKRRQCIPLDPQFSSSPLSSIISTPPISHADWDAYHASLSAGQLPSKPDLLDFKFKIRVLTFDRPRSLARLLDSLNQLIFDDPARDHISLEISIDYPADMTQDESVHNWRTVSTICNGFQWKQGDYSVIQQTQNIGLTGQWTWGWNNPDEDGTRKEIILFLEDDTALVPHSWIWMKHIIRQYYLNPYNYDENLYGFSLQSQHTILGESKQWKYGKRGIHDMMPEDTYYYRYQLLGTWGTVFFPTHWSVFTSWLKQRSFQHARGTSSVGFKPCVPSLLSNSWWQANPKRVWSQWMVRFAYEKGWYSLYTNFHNQSSLVVNYREGGLNFATAKGPMNPAVTSLRKEYMQLPPLAQTPLYDYHFRDWREQKNHLKYQDIIVSGMSSKPSSTPASATSSLLPASSSTLTSHLYRDECYILGQLKTVLATKETLNQQVQEEEKQQEEMLLHALQESEQKRKQEAAASSRIGVAGMDEETVSYSQLAAALQQRQGQQQQRSSSSSSSTDSNPSLESQEWKGSAGLGLDRLKKHRKRIAYETEESGDGEESEEMDDTAEDDEYETTKRKRKSKRKRRRHEDEEEEEEAILAAAAALKKAKLKKKSASENEDEEDAAPAKKKSDSKKDDKSKDSNKDKKKDDSKKSSSTAAKKSDDKKKDDKSKEKSKSSTGASKPKDKETKEKPKADAKKEKEKSETSDSD